MQAPLSYRIHDNSFWLSAGRCIYWENRKTLILSDLHFGKTGHFRKAGIAVPQHVYKEDLHCLLQQVQFFKPEKVVVVGDLFHSDANKEHDLFKKWRHDMNGTEVHLVRGNHDSLQEKMYTDLDIFLHEDYLDHDPIVFVHDITKNPKIKSPTYSISGHIHPGIRISGLGKQALRFPCFYFTKNFAVLPAFSKFTGMALIDPKENENVFAIVENKLLQIQ
jgi:uncharacterized protein